MNPDFSQEATPEVEQKVPVWKQIARAAFYLLYHAFEQMLYAVSVMWQGMVPALFVWLALRVWELDGNWLYILISLTALRLSFRTVTK